MRRLSINAILHTDMSRHFGTVAMLDERAARLHAQAIDFAADAKSEGGGQASLPESSEVHTSRTRRDVPDGRDSVPSPGLRALRRSKSADASSSSAASPPPHPSFPTALQQEKDPSIGDANRGDAHRAALLSPPFDASDPADRSTLVALLVHLGDLSGQAGPERQRLNWSDRILAEFRSQASAERALGLPSRPSWRRSTRPCRPRGCSSRS